MWSVMVVEVEGWCAVLGNLVQSESAQKGFVRTQYKRGSKDSKYQTKPHTLNDRRISRSESASKIMRGL